jgi:hypothetical protein
VFAASVTKTQKKLIAQGVDVVSVDTNSIANVTTTVRYNAATHTIDIDDLVATGGNITLYGNIISTGNGRLEVSDGYGSISITGNDNYDLSLGRIDTGLGTQGTIKITDTSKTRISDNVALTTVYTRDSTGTKVSQGYGTDLLPVASSSQYDVTLDRWLTEISGTGFVASKTTVEDKKTYISIFSSSTTTSSYDTNFDFTQNNKVSGTFLVTKPVELYDGNTLKSSISGANVIGYYNRTVTTEETEWSPWHKIVNGWIFYKEEERTRTSTSHANEQFQTFINASQPITIAFSGNATTGDITITDVIATLASANFNSGNDISISNTTAKDFNVIEKFDATAGNNILFSNVATKTGTTILTATTATTGDITISGGSFNTETNAFTATANNISISNVTTTAGTTILKTTTGDITFSSGTAQFDNAKITAGKDVGFNNGVIVTLKGSQNNSDGNVLTVLANHDILFGGTINVSEKRSIIMTTVNSEIVDRNGDIINLNAPASNVILTAARGIGVDDSLELRAATLDFEVTGNGNVSINSLADITINNGKTTNGLIDFYSDGAVVVGNIFAGGANSDFLLGMTKSVTFLANGTITAGNRIAVIAQGGDIYSAAQNITESVQFDASYTNLIAAVGKIYGNANLNNGFITIFKKGVTNLISGSDLLIYETSMNDVEYGTIVSGGNVSIMSLGEGNISIEKIVSNKIEFNQGLVQISDLSDTYYVDVAAVIGEDISKIRSRNKALFNEQFDISVDEVVITDITEGAILEMDTMSIGSGTNFNISGDNLIIDQINAGIDSSLTHQGGSSEIAETTWVKEIISNGDFIFKNMKSDWVYVYTDSVNGVLHVLDSYNGIRANYDINGVSVIVDSKMKSYPGVYSYFRNKESAPDFRFWTLDSKYAFNVTSSATFVDYPSIRVLNAFNQHLILNNNATYWDSAFENLLVDDRDLGEKTDALLSRVNNRSTDWLNLERVGGLISGSPHLPTNSILDTINPFFSPIMPITDDEKEEQENNNEKINNF